MSSTDFEYPKISLASGVGGFTDGGDYVVITTEPAPLPMSNIIAGRSGGTVVTENGGGFTFFENSREYRLSEFTNSPQDDTPSERVYLTEGTKKTRINKGWGIYAYTLHGRGYTVFKSLKNGILSETEVSMIKDGAVKVYKVTLKNMSEGRRAFNCEFEIKPALFWRTVPEYIFSEREDGMLKIKNALSGFEMWLMGDEAECVLPDGLCQDKSVSYNVTLDTGEDKTLYFAFSAKKEFLKGLDFDYEIKKSKEYFANISKIKLNSEDKYLDKLFSDWLLYQTVSSRFNARAGYYQAGGAIGFRDQLQDCLAVLYTDTAAVRAHILDCAAHQFKEGDVQHWWHPPYWGVRTQMTDDMLFLPYVTARYIEVTGDTAVLEELIPFLEGRKLDDGEEASLFNPDVSSEKGTLLEHCLRAIKRALRFGEHGLLLIGAGDWNDALNGIGMQKRGESVWLSMFCYMVMNDFLRYADTATRVGYTQIIEKIKSAVGKTFENHRFKRAFTDSGVWLGADGSPAAKIDLLTQSFAQISGIAAQKNVAEALSCGEKMVDEAAGLIKLLDPAFNKKFYAGYISSYPEGLRENGGQYTHAAIWYIKALADFGRLDRAYELLRLINPAEKCADPEKFKMYMGEPYVVPADIYTNKDNYGRCGWTWYTGSSSWAYITVLESILGIKLYAGKLKVRCSVPERMYGAELTFNYGNSAYKIRFQKSDKRHVTVNGIETAEKGEPVIPLTDGGKTFEVTVYCNKDAL